MGRPPWIPTDDILQKIERLASQGMDEKDIAVCVGVGYQTFSTKKHDFPEIQETLKKGYSKGLDEVTEALLQNIKKGNLTAQIFYLKCKGGWVEKREDPSASENGQTLMQKLIDKL